MDPTKFMANFRRYYVEREEWGDELRDGEIIAYLISDLFYRGVAAECKAQLSAIAATCLDWLATWYEPAAMEEAVRKGAEYAQIRVNRSRSGHQ
jgi:hypothetical protein